MEEKLAGIIIPAVTPFDENGEIDFDKMKYNYEKWNKTAVKGFMCLGTNGEFRAVSDDEALKVIKAASEYRAEGKTLIAGVGRESLHETLSFINRMKEDDVKVDFVSVITPCYFAKLMTDEALVKYYTAVADASPYPVMLYCAPSYVNNVTISVDAVKALAGHPNIYGIKDTSGTMMESYMNAVGNRDDFTVMAGSLSNLLMCLDMGGHGGVVSAANYFPDQCAKFLEMYNTGDRETAVAYLDKLKKLAKDTGGRGSVAGVKCAMSLAGYQGGYPRSPILPVADDIASEMKAAMEQSDLC